MSELNRADWVTMLNTTPSTTATYSIMGTGFESLDDSRSPQTDTVTYIDDRAATKTVTGYEPEWSFEGKRLEDGDSDALDFLVGIALAESVGDDAETDIVEYDVTLVQTGEVDAYQHTVAVAMDSISKGAGGENLKFSGTLLGKGDVVAGTYNIAAGTFTPTVS